MAARSFLSVRELSPAALVALTTRAVDIADAPTDIPAALDGSIVATFFEQTSTRTRTAFSVAALRLGAELVNYGPESLQLNTGETLGDTARILGMMLDGVVIRTRRTLADLTEMLDNGGPPLINAMAREEHPTQAICDLSTVLRHHGALDGISMLYVGEGNNSASALAYALARVPNATLTLYVPHGYGLDNETLARAAMDARPNGATIRQVEQAVDLPDDVQVVYTTRWQTTGTTKPDSSWRELFRPYHVDTAFLDRWPDAVFMHDLPAHRGDEVSGEVLEGKRSLVWRQAQMKLFSAMSIVETFWRRQ
ncbi:MAG: ornithine carbamoyltransferase [Kibdelosporangium sp.]